MKSISSTSIRTIQNYEDFDSVFKVFESFPFFESWDSQEVRQEFEVNQKEGTIFGYYVDDKCVGFIAVRCQHSGEHPVHFEEGSKVLYISDIAVLPNHRRNGIGTLLLQYVLQFCKMEGYSFAYLRTNEKNPMGYGIYSKNGFYRIFDACEEIIRTRTDNKRTRSDADLRIFMFKEI